jgi:predicted DsbA family dithiol-disulfide isomerase
MDASQPLHLYFDYVDPASFLLEKRVRALIHNASSSLLLHPFELQPPPGHLLDPEEEWAQRWTPLAGEAREFGIRLSPPWIVPWTRKAHELALHAGEHGCFEEIHDALFRAYLTANRDIGRIDILVNLAREQGMDPLEAKAVLDVDRFLEPLEAWRVEGLERGVSRTPTLFRGEEALEGYPKADELESFLGSVTNNDEP